MKTHWVFIVWLLSWFASGGTLVYFMERDNFIVKKEVVLATAKEYKMGAYSPETGLFVFTDPCMARIFQKEIK